MLAREQHGAGLDQVAGIAAVALAEDDLTALPAAGDSHLRDLGELPLVKAVEHLGPSEQPDGLLPRRHEGHNLSN
jgi:hypothetical protein